jgi:hypothetical protein
MRLTDPTVSAVALTEALAGGTVIGLAMTARHQEILLRRPPGLWQFLRFFKGPRGFRILRPNWIRLTISS